MLEFFSKHLPFLHKLLKIVLSVQRHGCVYKDPGTALFETKVFDRLLIHGPGENSHKGASERARCAPSEVAAHPLFLADKTNHACQTVAPAQLQPEKFWKVRVEIIEFTKASQIQANTISAYLLPLKDSSILKPLTKKLSL